MPLDDKMLSVLARTITNKVPSIRDLNRQASELRVGTARELAGAFLRNQRDVQRAVPSHHDLYSDKLPLPSGPAAITFNKLVTDTVLKRHVLGLDDPYVVTFLSSKVIEQTFYQYLDPRAPTQAITNLSVAKHFGTFFTPPDIATVMAKKLADRADGIELLDPCLGSGVLLCAAMLHGGSPHYKRIIGVELDAQLAFWAAGTLRRVAELTSYGAAIEVNVGDGLEYLATAQSRSLGRHVIVNPPYGRLRFTKDRLTNRETALASPTESDAEELKNLLSRQGERVRAAAKTFRERGIPELSRLFFRMCAEHASRGASIAFISPDSWMSGFDSSTLRAHLVNKRLVEEIILCREGERNFATVNQATAVSFINSDKRTHLVIRSSLKDEGQGLSYVAIETVDPRFLSIPRVSGRSLELFNNLATHRKLRDLPWCVNARGEVDQTLQRDLFSACQTGIPLVHGEHIDRFTFRHSSSEQKPGFVSEARFLGFIADKPKRKDFERARIVGRQCSYAEQKRRLMFARIPAKYAVGNSCNYLVIDGSTDAEREMRSRTLLGVLNSGVVDWYFRALNSNNHVANYEIDALPFPPDDSWLTLISTIVLQIEHRNAVWKQDLLEAAVGLAFGLESEQDLSLVLHGLAPVRLERIMNLARHLRKRSLKALGDETFFNHEEPALSALDSMIISHVPEGGNWQSIPTSVPSKRLEQIREMTAERGVVRTTYYGRLRRDQPAYTINTYFNRPGNGTHIHPSLPRTLTSREAARLQSFPDSYLFSGGDGAVRDQVGNAVPPLLARAIGEKLRAHAESALCVDVFCGAGGLSLGLEASGWKVVAAIDNEASALETYALNRPSCFEPIKGGREQTLILNRDLTKKAAFEKAVRDIRGVLAGRQLDLIAGGPPCQGFSHAGFRLDDDERNDLASTHLHFAERLRPRIFLLENVEGLLTYRKGQVLADIVQTLRDLGYRVCQPIWRLCAEQYGVPQMRRRVFVVATTDASVDLAPPKAEFKQCGGRRTKNGSGLLFDRDLAAPIAVESALAGLSLPGAPSPPDWYLDFAL